MVDNARRIKCHSFYIERLWFWKQAGKNWPEHMLTILEHAENTITKGSVCCFFFLVWFNIRLFFSSKDAAIASQSQIRIYLLEFLIRLNSSRMKNRINISASKYFVLRYLNWNENLGFNLRFVQIRNTARRSNGKKNHSMIAKLRRWIKSIWEDSTDYF